MQSTAAQEDHDDIARFLHGARAPPRPHPPAQVLLFPVCNGPRLAAILGVERPALSPRWMRVLASIGGAADDLGDESAGLRRACAAAGRLLLGALLLAYRGGERSAFSIPMTLRQAHGLGWS